MSVRGWLSGAGKHEKIQIPSDLVVKSQAADIIDLILQLIGHPNGVYRPCRNRKSRGAVLSTSEGQWATTKFDGVCLFLSAPHPSASRHTPRLTPLPCVSAR